MSEVMTRETGNEAGDLRRKYGMISGAVGIFLNICLFAGKFLAGTLTGSVSVTADAFNNLSDAASSVVTLIGFKLAGQKPDTSHPFGHGRLEYVSGLIVSMLIILMGFELLTSSAEKILHPGEVTTGILSICILSASIAVKLVMFFYNSKLAAWLDSVVLRSVAADSRGDALATGFVLAASLICKFTGLSLDGWAGLIIAGYILYSGIRSAIDTIDPLLGQPADPEMVKEICRIVVAHEEILGVHDLVIHDYGPGRCMVSLHAEVPADINILKAHDVIDRAEREIRDQLHIDATIHMDPISIHDPETVELRNMVSFCVHSLGSEVSFHDFRVVHGETHTNLIFDVLVPFGFRLTDDEVKKTINSKVQQINGACECVIQVDKKYIA